MPNELPEQKWLLKDRILATLGKFRRLLTAFDRCTLNKGALFASEIVQGILKWSLTGGSHLIEVTACLN